MDGVLPLPRTGSTNTAAYRQYYVVELVTRGTRP